MTLDLPGGLDFKLLHAGVAVPCLGPTTELLTDRMGYRVDSGPFDDPLQQVKVIFLAKSDRDEAEIELIAPLGEDSPIQSMMAKSGGALTTCALRRGNLTVRWSTPGRTAASWFLPRLLP